MTKEQKIIAGLLILLIIGIGAFIWDKSRQVAQMEKPLKETELNIKIKDKNGNDRIIPIAEAFRAIQISALQMIKLPDGREMTMQTAIYEDLQKIKAAAGIP